MKNNINIFNQIKILNQIKKLKLLIQLLKWTLNKINFIRNEHLNQNLLNKSQSQYLKKIKLKNQIKKNK